MEKALESAPVRRVRTALTAAGLGDPVIALTDTARSAQEAADALQADLGAIVKSLIFMVGETPVMALVSGDRQCDVKALPRVLGLAGKAKRADADQVRAATGFAIGGVSPFAHPAPLPIAMDQGLFRFATVHAAAGHPHCVFPIAPETLANLTGANISADLGKA
ncbi:MAG: YbaK/EbsC family protein [Magnetospiraceae bacterium]